MDCEDSCRSLMDVLDGPARQLSSVQRGSVEFLSIAPGHGIEIETDRSQNDTGIPVQARGRAHKRHLNAEIGRQPANLCSRSRRWHLPDPNKLDRPKLNRPPWPRAGDGPQTPSESDLSSSRARLTRLRQNTLWVCEVPPSPPVTDENQRNPKTRITPSPPLPNYLKITTEL